MPPEEIIACLHKRISVLEFLIKNDSYIDEDWAKALNVQRREEIAFLKSLLGMNL